MNISIQNKQPMPQNIHTLGDHMYGDDVKPLNNFPFGQKYFGWANVMKRWPIVSILYHIMCLSNMTGWEVVLRVRGVAFHGGSTVKSSHYDHSC